MYKIRESELDEFIDFSHKISLKYNNWVCNLKNNERKLLSLNHPFWKKAERKLFVVEKNGNIIGKIAGIINYAYDEFHNEKTAFFGFFDCIDDEKAAGMLLKNVEDFAKEKGYNRIIGPANPSSNYTWGVLIENFDESNVIMMPYNPPYYADLLESNGYVKEKDLYAFKWIYIEEIMKRFEGVLNKIYEENKEIRIEFANLDDINSVFNDFKNVYNKAWEKNWGFVPMSDEEIEETFNELKKIIKKEYVLFAKDGEKAVAFCLMLPDFNIALKAFNKKTFPLNWLVFFSTYLF